MVWKRINTNSWGNKEREVRIDIEENKRDPDSYRYSAILYSTFPVAGGSKFIAGSDIKSKVVSKVKEYIKEHP